MDKANKNDSEEEEESDEDNNQEKKPEKKGESAQMKRESSRYCIDTETRLVNIITN